jgi:hypothetical protein
MKPHSRKKNTVMLALKSDFLLSLGIITVLFTGQITACSQEEILEESDVLLNEYTGKIRVNLENLSSQQLLVSAPPGTTQILCQVGTTPCTSGDEQVRLLKSAKKPDGTQFFLIPLSIDIASDMTMRLGAKDQSGKTIEERAIKFVKSTPSGSTVPTQQRNTGTGPDSGTTGNTGTPGNTGTVPNSGTTGSTGTPGNTGASQPAS